LRSRCLLRSSRCYIRKGGENAGKWGKASRIVSGITLRGKKAFLAEAEEDAEKGLEPGVGRSVRLLATGGVGGKKAFLAEAQRTQRKA
jgi:hypothetical protein